MTTRGVPNRWPSRAALGIFGIGIGLSAGYLGPVGWDELTSPNPSTPRLRVAAALERPHPEASPRAWKWLTKDVEEVRRGLDPKERSVFDLVSASVGLESSGVANLSRLRQECRQLRWPSCEDRTLEDLKKRIGTP